MIIRWCELRVLICGDVHWCNYSSIVRKRGENYSKRLENCIETINWVERTAEENECERIIYLGDFFDRSDMNAEEISALKEIDWSSLKHEIIVGNHELGSASGNYSTANVLSLLPNFNVISEPYLDVGFGRYFLYLPYIFEKDRKQLLEYFRNLIGSDFTTQEVKRLYVFSHNDLKGVNYGAFESKEGFDLDDIQNSCDYFFNGHIHNGMNVSNKIIDVGNITGQNFNEDAAKYNHRVIVLDTKTEEITSIVNPFAFNFYKVEIDSIPQLNSFIGKLKTNAIVSLKCGESILQSVKEELDKCKKVVEYRVISVIDRNDEEVGKIDDFSSIISSDHLKQFNDYVIDKLGSSKAILQELQEVLNAG